MKIRMGFVTNSSSTNHIILWRGEKNDLRKYLEKIDFPTKYERWEVTKEEIIEAIMSKVDNAVRRDVWVEELTEELENSINNFERDTENKFKLWFGPFYTINEITEQLSVVAGGEMQGGNYDWVLNISFGDNEGDFTGDALGYVMDYEGRKIYYEDEWGMDGFVYITEQNR